MNLNFTEKGSGPVAILMHGMFGSLSNLGNLARHLAPTHRVISVDLRNHGDSPQSVTMDIPAMAEDIVELMDDLSLGEAILIGHSLGGKVGMQVALNNVGRVSKLVVADISPVAYVPRQDAVLDALNALSKTNVGSRQQANGIVADYVQEPQTRAFLLKNLHRNKEGRYILKLNMAAISENYGTSLVAAPEGEPYQGPSLFLKGETSAYIQSKHQPIIQALFPNSELYVISQAGHWLHAEKPDEFNAKVSNFLISN